MNSTSSQRKKRPASDTSLQASQTRFGGDALVNGGADAAGAAEKTAQPGSVGLLHSFAGGTNEQLDAPFQTRSNGIAERAYDAGRRQSRRGGLGGRTMREGGHSG